MNMRRGIQKNEGGFLKFKVTYQSDISFNKIFLLLIGVVLSILPLSATKVDAEKAGKIAQDYLQSKLPLLKQKSVHLKFIATQKQLINEHSSLTSDNQDTVFYYVFNINEDAGFIIVSGDDVVTPILGFSENGNYNENNLPPNFAGWMDYLIDEIRYIIAQKLPQSEKVKRELDACLNGNLSPNGERSLNEGMSLSGEVLSIANVVSPLMTTAWNQDTPYWNQCPLINGKRSLTGCGATVMAQIMKFHGHPVHGNGRSEAYYTKTTGFYVPALNFAVDYDWENMLDSYADSYTEQQAAAVATLMYHCGVSLKMNYSPNVSLSNTEDIPDALTAFFGYDKSIQTKYRVYYDNESWERMIRAQLDAGLPVIYKGGREDSHIFACDGYDSDNLFHFNWGWGGHADGWFVSTALDTDVGRFNTDQAIIVNIKPDENGVTSYDMVLYSIFTASSSSLQHNMPFTVSTRVWNIGPATFPGGSLGMALVNSDGQMVEIIGSNDIESLDNMYMTFLTDITCNIPLSVPQGQYKLKAVIKPADGDWEIINASSGCPNNINIQVGQISDDNANLCALTADPGSLSVAFNENVTTYYVNVPDSVESVNISATPTDSMATVSGTGIHLIDGNNSIYIVVTARDGETIKSYTITVVRSSETPTLTVSNTLLNYTYFTETKQLTITSNTNWTVSSNASWVTVSPISGSKNGSITVHVTANANTPSRTATILINGADIPAQTITIVQIAESEGIVWDLSPTMTAKMAYNVLTVSTSKGPEMMPNYTLQSPWSNSYDNYIYSAVIEDGVSTVGDGAFWGCRALTSVTIPKTVTSIGLRAFSGCSNLSSVTIPEGVRTIGRYAFQYCNTLSTVSLPNTVTTIGRNAFYYCLALSSITIPKSVTKIEDYAFYECTRLKRVTVAWPTPLLLPEISYVFEYTVDATLYVPEGTKALYEVAPVWKNFGAIIEYDYTDNEDIGSSLVMTGLKAWTQNDILHISGLQPGQSLSIYNLAGQLVYYNIVKDAEEQIPLLKRGMYIIVAGDSSVKVFY